MITVLSSLAAVSYLAVGVAYARTHIAENVRTASRDGFYFTSDDVMVKVTFLVEMVLWPMDIVVRLLLMVVGFILTPVTRQINKPLAENRHRRSGR